MYRQRQSGEEEGSQERHRIGVLTSMGSIPNRHVVEQRKIEWLRRIQHGVVDTLLGGLIVNAVTCSLIIWRYCSRSASGTTGICSPLSRSSKLDASSNVKSISAGSRMWNRIAARCREIGSGERAHHLAALRRGPRSPPRSRAGRSARQLSAADQGASAASPAHDRWRRDRRRGAGRGWHVDRTISSSNVTSPTRSRLWTR